MSDSNKPVISPSPTLNNGRNELYAVLHGLAQAGSQPNTSGDIQSTNHLVITGTNFGTSPTVKLTHTGVTTFSKVDQNNSPQGNQIEYWFSAIASQGKDVNVLAGTLSVVVETLETDPVTGDPYESDPSDANDGATILIRHVPPGP